MIDRTSTKFEKRGPILERHGRVDVEEAAAVRAELLDRDLRGDGAQREGLIPALERGGRDRAAEGLKHALRDEDQGDDHRERQEDVIDAADRVLPEVADARRPPGR